MDNLYFVALLTFVGSVTLVTILIPKIIWIVESRELIDHPDSRSSHKNSTPTMGGVSFFLVLLFILSLINPWDANDIAINLISALALMFAVGLKDDLMISTPKAKLGSEVLAIFFILFCDCLKISSLGGFLGIESIPSLLSYVFIIVFILTMINSFNMIDGIDGLASTIGIVIFTIYSFIFYTLGFHFYFLLCLSLLGILLGYLRFNLSSTNKIFMGDTGSLIIGFCIAFLSVRFLATDPSILNAHSFAPENSLIIIGAIFFIPLFDTLRVIGVRLLNKTSPLGSDNNHIHHILINLEFTHFKASLILCFLNLIIALSFIFLSLYLNSYQLLGVLIICFIFFIGFFYKLKTSVKVQS